MSDSTNSEPVCPLLNSADLMEEFLCASQRGNVSLRENWLAREALQSIIRLVRVEQMLEIRRSVNRLVPSSMRAQSLRRVRRNQRRHPGQTQLAFGRDE